MKNAKLINVKLDPKKIYPDKILIKQNNDGFWVELKNQEITVSANEISFNNINNIVIKNIINEKMKYIKPQELEEILKSNYEDYQSERTSKLSTKMSIEFIDSLKIMIGLYTPKDNEVSEYEETKKIINEFDTNTYYFKENGNNIVPIINDDIDAIIKAVKFKVYQENCDRLINDVPLDNSNNVIINYDLEKEKLLNKEISTEKETSQVSINKKNDEIIKKILNKTYHEINEQDAKMSKRNSSFNKYVENSATNEYRKVIDETREKAIEKLENLDLNLYNQERLLKKLTKFEKQYANYKNKEYNIGAMNPSQIISGAGGFNHRKHNKQMDSYDNLFSSYGDIESLQNSIINFEPIKEKIEKKYNVDKTEDYENKHFKVVQNEEINRVQLKFDDKPEVDVRTLIKKSGFKWAPSQKSWQRQLTPNAMNSIMTLIKNLDELKQAQELKEDENIKIDNLEFIDDEVIEKLGEKKITNENSVLLNANSQQEVVEQLNKRLEDNLEDYEFQISSTGTNFIKLSSNTTCRSLLDFGHSKLEAYLNWTQECFDNYVKASIKEVEKEKESIDNNFINEAIVKEQELSSDLEDEDEDYDDYDMGM